MRRILLAAGVASAALVMAGLTAPAALASGTNATCNTGFLVELPPGTYQNVTVPAGANCLINSSDIITGNVTVATGAGLFDVDAPIGGNLQADHAQSIGVFGGSIGGNLQETASAATVVCGGIGGGTLTVGNDLIVQGTGALSVGTDIGGNSQICSVQFATGAVTVGGNLTVQNNAGRVDVQQTTVAGNISVHNNTGGGVLGANSAGGNCQLFNDNPPIFGIANTVPPGHKNTCNQSA
jgi:hypothetical protein